jgi:hypothetical protein
LAGAGTIGAGCASDAGFAAQQAIPGLQSAQQSTTGSPQTAARDPPVAEAICIHASNTQNQMALSRFKPEL